MKGAPLRIETYTVARLSQDTARTQVYALRDEAQKKLSEAEKIADDYGIEFSFNPAYGMGGSYRPDPNKVNLWEGTPDDYEIEIDDDGSARYTWGDDYGEEGGYWQSSSHGC